MNQGSPDSTEKHCPTVSPHTTLGSSVVLMAATCHNAPKTHFLQHRRFSKQPLWSTVIPPPFPCFVVSPSVPFCYFESGARGKSLADLSR